MLHFFNVRLVGVGASTREVECQNIVMPLQGAEHVLADGLQVEGAFRG